MNPNARLKPLVTGLSRDKTALAPGRRPGPRRNRAAGFTLIEIMVVVVIIGLLATLILPKVVGRQDQAFQEKAKADIRALSSAVKLYKLDNFKYPSSSEGLSVLVTTKKGYIERLPKDPWGNAYQYEAPGQHLDFDIWTLGADGRAGGGGVDQDIGNWNMDDIEL